MVRGFGRQYFGTFHCEKTSFITLAGIVGVIYFAYLGFVLNDFPTIQFFFVDEPITFLYLFAIILIGGYLGVIGYRIANNKRPVFVLNFLKADV